MNKFFLAYLVILASIMALAPEADAEPCTDYGTPPGRSSGHTLGSSILLHAIASQENYAYVCFKPGQELPVFRSYRTGPFIFDHITFGDTTYLPTSTSRIILRDDFAVLAMGSLGLGLIDISNPEMMSNLTTVPTGDICRDLATLGPNHMVTAEWSALRIYDFQDPTNPLEVGGITLSQARSVAIADNLALVACGNLGLAIVDITNPAEPSFLTQVPVGGFVDQVSAEGNLVYLTGYMVGLVTVDVTIPTSPTIVDVLPLEGQPEAMVIRDGYAYITVGEAVTVVPELPDFDAMALVRLNQTGTPAVVDYFFPNENYNCLALGDDRVLLGKTATSYNQLIMAPLQCPEISGVPAVIPGDLSLADPYPNPFNPRVQVRFKLSVGRSGRLTLHDLRGLLMVDVWHGVGTGQEITATWNGTDRHGRACPSGVYHFRLTDQSGRQSATVRATLLR